MEILSLAVKSLWNRRLTAFLTLFSISLSVLLLLGVEKLRTEARVSFTNTIAGTDLIVGARTGSTQLLLYSIFHMGNATNNISWNSYQHISQLQRVKWAVPISLGDSHQGFRVMGTTEKYFEHYQFGHNTPLSFRQGQSFDKVYEAVLGADVAKQLGYRLNQNIIVTHGSGKGATVGHDDKPFTVVGILQKTGTPVDRTVIVPLAGVEAIHIDWQGGSRASAFTINAERALKHDLTPKAVTAVLLGLNSRIATFKVQRQLNDYPHEALMAILPGVALQELWDMMTVAEKALLIISILVILVGLMGMVTSILTSLNERRREMAILRSVGARPLHILLLIMGEAVAITLSGIIIGVILLYIIIGLSQPILESHFSLFITVNFLSPYEMGLLLIVLVAGLVVSLVPALQAYRYSLADGMTIRI